MVSIPADIAFLDHTEVLLGDEWNIQTPVTTLIFFNQISALNLAKLGKFASRNNCVIFITATAFGFGLVAVLRFFERDQCFCSRQTPFYFLVRFRLNFNSCL